MVDMNFDDENGFWRYRQRRFAHKNTHNITLFSVFLGRKRLTKKALGKKCI